MIGFNLLISAVLVAPPTTVNSPWSPDEVCAAGPSAPANIEISFSDNALPGGLRVLSASAVYELSNGDLAEAYLEADSSGYAELSIAIDGEVVMRSAAEPARVLPGAENDNSDDLSLTSMWDELDADYPPQLLAELIHHDVLAAMTIGMVPEEFKCSRFGKRVMKAAKYATYGVATAVTAACCTSVSPACLACAFSAGAAGGAIGDAFDDYCG